MAQRSFDVIGGVFYILCAVIELGIFASHLVWRLRTRRLRRDLKLQGRTFDDLITEQSVAAVAPHAASTIETAITTASGDHQGTFGAVYKDAQRWADRTWPPPAFRKVFRWMLEWRRRSNAVDEDG